MFFGGGASKNIDSSGGMVGGAHQAQNQGASSQSYSSRSEYRSGGVAGGDRPERLQQMPTSIKAGHDVTDKEKFETELISMHTVRGKQREGKRVRVNERLLRISACIIFQCCTEEYKGPGPQINYVFLSSG